MCALGPVTLVGPSGIVTLGVPIGRLLRRLGAGGGIYPVGLAWPEIVGCQAPIGMEDIRAAVRRWFSHREILARASGALASFGFSYRATMEAQRGLLEQALADDWPVRIEQAPALVAAVRRAAAPAPCATEQGLLWLVADSLALPWGAAECPLPDVTRARRFARIALLTTGLDDGALARERGKTATSERRAPLSTTMALLAPGRLVERDSPIRWVVRLIELYDELLDLTEAERTAFTRSTGVDLRTWIVKVCSLASFVESQIAAGAARTPLLPLRDVPDTPAAKALVTIVRKLARTSEEHRIAIARSAASAVDKRLGFQALRETPILDLGGGEYLVLHKDFLLASADDGVWYALAAAIGPTFGSRFGNALEAYVQRVLSRMAESAGGQLAEVPSMNAEPRCDFALRIGDDLFLIDSKRSGLAAAHLMGDPSAIARLVDELGHGCKQLLSTACAIAAGALADVLSVLGVRPEWRPRRIIPVLVTHRPVFVVFSSGEDLVRSVGLIEKWQSTFGAMPSVWSLSDLELLEAAVPAIDVARLVTDFDSRLPAASAGVPEYLSNVDYRGLVASSYFDRRRHEILAPYTDGQPPDSSLSGGP